MSGQFHAAAALPLDKQPPVPEGWVYPKASLDAVKKRKIFCDCREPNPDFRAVQPVARRFSDSAIPVLII
jgi:hypothetical protein